jgi:cardiolipin synthase
VTEQPWTLALELGGIIILCVIGFLHVVHALMNARTAQGAIAWIISLATFPFLAIPLYWIAGHRRFAGRVRSRRVDNQKLREASENTGRPACDTIPSAQTAAGGRACS